jgi:hypothetical protein
MHPRRTRGSAIPRMAGVGVVALIAGAGLILYLGSAAHPAAHQAAPRQHAPTHHSALSVKVLAIQTVGLVDVGPYDDGDSATNDFDDHPLMLRGTSAGIEFVGIARAELAAGVPLWTQDQMADGSEIFIYIPTGQCLAAAPDRRQLALEHCNLGPAQRWRTRHQGSAGGLPFDQYANLASGRCVSAPKAAAKHSAKASPIAAGVAPFLAACGPVHDKSQEIGLWWGG